MDNSRLRSNAKDGILVVSRHYYFNGSYKYMTIRHLHSIDVKGQNTTETIVILFR